MNITTTSSAEGFGVSLEGTFTIADVSEVKAALSTCLGEHDLTIDVRAVEKIDAAGLQLLLLLKKELGERLHVVHHSDAVRRAMEFCNVIQYFGDPVVLPAHEG